MKEHVGVGAFNLVRCEVHVGVGTHRAIRMRPDGDMKLAKLLKGKGFGSSSLSCLRSRPKPWGLGRRPDGAG